MFSILTKALFLKSLIDFRIIIVWLLPLQVIAANLDQGVSIRAGAFLPTGYWSKNFDKGYFSALSVNAPLPYSPLNNLNLLGEVQFSYFNSTFKGYSQSNISNAASLFGPRIIYNYSAYFNPSFSMLFGVSYTNLKLQPELTLTGDQLNVFTVKPTYFFSLGNEFFLSDSLVLDLSTMFHTTYLDNNSFEGFILSAGVSYRSNFFKLKRHVPIASSNIEVLDIELVDILPSQIFSLNNQGLGMLELKAKETIQNIQVNTSLTAISDNTQSLSVITELKKGDTTKIILPITLNNQIVNNLEELTLTLNIDINYNFNDEDATTQVQHQVTIYPRNYFDWRNSEQVVSFITPRDSEIFNLARRLVRSSKKYEENIIDSRSKQAMLLFNSLSSMGLTYKRDPSLGSGSSKRLSSKSPANDFDYVLFPSETLSHEGGDCEDLVILYASLLESLGIETALISIPDHILLMYNTGKTTEQVDNYKKEYNEVFNMHGTVWIPIEVTKIENSFVQAWEAGANRLNQAQAKNKKNVEIILVRAAWDNSPPLDTSRMNIKPIEYNKISESKIKNKMISDFKLISKSTL
jgi:hypothetical protein